MRIWIRGLLTTACLAAVILLPLAGGAAVIQLPVTGQTKCYDFSGSLISCSGTGQDGNIMAGAAWPGTRFTVSGDCVTDNLTGLVWTKNGNHPGRLLDWKESIDYITSINNTGICGYKDWRLPNINEIESLVNSGVTNPAEWLNKQGFYDVQSSAYCSSTTYSPDSDYAWCIDMWNGIVKSGLKTELKYVWPVRAGQSGASDANYPANVWKTGQTTDYYSSDDGKLQKGVAWPDPKFTDNGNGTVTDNLTGLTWLKDTNCFSSMAWQNALTTVGNFNSNPKNFGCSGYNASFNDWRLPNRKELLSLIDRSASNPAFPYYSVLPAYRPFPNLVSYIYWSSTSYMYNTESALVVSLLDGEISFNSKVTYNYVWPVRYGAGSGNNCAATVSIDNYLNVPVINFNNAFFKVTLVYTPTSDGIVWFKVTASGELQDTSPFNNCQASTLSAAYVLHIPELVFNNISYSVDLQYVPGSGNDILFKIISAAVK